MPVYADLSDEIVLITGGANGIGAAMVRAFQQQKARVYFCDVDSRAGEALAAELEVSFARVDLTREAEVKRWVKSVGRVGTIRALVNNAARDPRLALEKVTAKFWDDLFNTNLRAYFFAAQQVAPHMTSGSSIINFSSITYHVSPAEMSTYVATKAGAQGLTRALARELGPRGIRVNTISPGWIMTERQKREFVDAKAKRMILRSQCVPKLIQPEEIAEVALFLASESSRAMTGQELLCDRGWAHS